MPKDFIFEAHIGVGIINPRPCIKMDPQDLADYWGIPLEELDAEIERRNKEMEENNDTY